jgi:hypothetical protein
MTAALGSRVSAAQIIVDLIQKEGVWALFKGALPRAVWIAPLGAMNFAGYELAKRAMGVGRAEEAVEKSREAPSAGLGVAGNAVKGIEDEKVVGEEVGHDSMRGLASAVGEHLARIGWGKWWGKRLDEGGVKSAPECIEQSSTDPLRCGRDVPIENDCTEHGEQNSTFVVDRRAQEVKTLRAEQGRCILCGRGSGDVDASCADGRSTRVQRGGLGLSHTGAG